jgi:hypothetical protein
LAGFKVRVAAFQSLEKYKNVPPIPYFFENIEFVTGGFVSSFLEEIFYNEN